MSQDTKTIEQYAIDLLVDGARSTAEDDTNEDGKVDEHELEPARNLALNLIRHIENNQQAFLTWARASEAEQHPAHLLTTEPFVTPEQAARADVLTRLIDPERFDNLELGGDPQDPLRFVAELVRYADPLVAWLLTGKVSAALDADQPNTSGVPSVLSIPMQRNDAQVETVGQYLIALAQNVWREGECFSGKRPFGNSSWEWEVYEALAAAGVITSTIKNYGDRDIADEQRHKADELIAAALTILAGTFAAPALNSSPDGTTPAA